VHVAARECHVGKIEMGIEPCGHGVMLEGKRVFLLVSGTRVTFLNTPRDDRRLEAPHRAKQTHIPPDHPIHR
jgi:hypothetical protein